MTCVLKSAWQLETMAHTGLNSKCVTGSAAQPRSSCAQLSSGPLSVFPTTELTSVLQGCPGRVESTVCKNPEDLASPSQAVSGTEELSNWRS